MRVLFNRYEFREKIGSGGWGEVYRGWDRKLEREVAIKEVPLLSSSLDEVLNEGRAIARLNHPNIVTLFDLEVASRSCFLIMDYLPGVSLEEAVRRLGPLPLEIGIYLFYQYLKGLEYAHLNQVIHGDIKPGNLLVLPDGQGKITDFGLAIIQSESRFRRKGFTPSFAPPEVIKEGLLNEKSDVYSFCLSFYTAITGKNPFQAETREATTYKVLNTFLPPLSRKVPEIPSQLDKAISQGLKKEAKDRLALEKLIEVWRENLPSSVEVRKKTRQFFQPLFATSKPKPGLEAKKNIRRVLGALFFSSLNFFTLSLFNLGYPGLNLSLSLLGGVIFFLSPFVSWLLYFSLLLVILVSKNLFLGLLFFLLVLFILRWTREKPELILIPFFAPYLSIANFDFLLPFLCGFSNSLIQALSLSFFSYLVNLLFYLFFKTHFPYLSLNHQPLIKSLSPLEVKPPLIQIFSMFSQNPWLYLEVAFWLSIAFFVWLTNRLFKDWWQIGIHFGLLGLYFFLNFSASTFLINSRLVFPSFVLRFSLSALSFLVITYLEAKGFFEKWKIFSD